MPIRATLSGEVLVLIVLVSLMRHSIDFVKAYLNLLRLLSPVRYMEQMKDMAAKSSRLNTVEMAMSVAS